MGQQTHKKFKKSEGLALVRSSAFCKAVQSSVRASDPPLPQNSKVAFLPNYCRENALSGNVISATGTLRMKLVILPRLFGSGTWSKLACKL